MPREERKERTPPGVLFFFEGAPHGRVGCPVVKPPCPYWQKKGSRPSSARAIRGMPLPSSADAAWSGCAAWPTARRGAAWPAAVAVSLLSPRAWRPGKLQQADFAAILADHEVEAAGRGLSRQAVQHGEQFFPRADVGRIAEDRSPGTAICAVGSQQHADLSLSWGFGRHAARVAYC